MADDRENRQGDSSQALRACNPLILLGHLAAGGSERQGYLLAKGLAAEGLQPGVIVWSLTHDDPYRGLLEEFRIPLAIAPQAGGALGKVRWLRRIVRQVRPPVLHAYAFYLNAVAAWAMRGINGVAIGSIRGDYAGEAVNGVFHYAVNRVWPETIIANSARAQDAARADQSPIHARNVLFVPNGLDGEVYRRRTHGSLEYPRVLGVGNLHPGKRWDRLIHAVALLQLTDPALNFALDIVGEGAERDNLAGLIADLKLQNRVSLLGRRYDVADLLASSDVFALVSESEGTPNAVMEAMATGLPVLATTVGDIPRLVQDGIHGLLVSATDEMALADGLRTLVSDHELRARMGAEAFRKAHAEFGMNRLVQNTLSAYREAASCK